MEYKIIINCILIAWWIVNFIPLQAFLDKYIKPKIKNEYIKNALSCFKCMSFWSVLIGIAYCDMRFGFIEAILASLIAYLYERIMNTIKIRL